MCVQYNNHMFEFLLAFGIKFLLSFQSFGDSGFPQGLAFVTLVRLLINGCLEERVPMAWRDHFVS